MKNKVDRFLRAYAAPGDRLTVAVSGGKDSMALLHSVWTLAEPLGMTVSAAHYNHGLRGDEALRDEDFIRDWCAACGIPLTVGRGDVGGYAAQHGLGVEEAARRLRYEFFGGLEGFVLTAHTAEDNLETVLLRLLRGSGLHGLSGIPPRRGNILRPMLEVTRREVAEYQAENHIPHVEDSTNALDDCVRNRLRHHVLPLLEQENPSLAVSAAALCGTLRAEDDYMAEQAQAALETVLLDDALDRSVLAALHPALQYRVMELYLAPVSGVTRAHLDAALALCESPSPSGSLDLPGGFRLRREYEALRLGPQAVPPAPAAADIAPGETVRFGDWEVSCRRAPRPERMEPGTLAIPGDASGLILRARRPGDVIRLSGGTKKVSRLMIDLKIPAARRDGVPLLCRGDTVLAALPYRAAAPEPNAGQDSLLLSAKRKET